MLATAWVHQLALCTHRSCSSYHPISSVGFLRLSHAHQLISMHAQDKLLAMEAAHRGSHAGDKPGSWERGAGDWQHYQPPSAVLSAAREARKQASSHAPASEQAPGVLAVPAKTMLSSMNHTSVCFCRLLRLTCCEGHVGAAMRPSARAWRMQGSDKPCCSGHTAMHALSGLHGNNDYRLQSVSSCTDKDTSLVSVSYMSQMCMKDEPGPK